MIKFLNKKNNYDFIHKFQWIKHYNKPKLNLLIVDTNNNSIIKNNNLIYPTYYSLLLLFNQKPLVKTTKKSIANFNIRPNMNLGAYLSINKNSLFLNNLFYYINSTFPTYKNNISYKNINNGYNIQINYGINNINSRMIGITHFNQSNKIGGCNFLFNFYSPVKFKPFYYLP